MRGWIGALIWMIGGGAIAAGAAIFLFTRGGDLSGVQGATSTSGEAAAPARPCPPPLTTPGRNPSMPVDDVFGVRPGVTVEEARALILCRDDAFEFQFEDVWHSAQARTASQRQLMQARRPGELFVVGLTGPLGQERVAAVWRDESFGLSAAPAIATLKADLAAQYGPPHLERATEFTHLMAWSFAPDGRATSDARPKPAGFIERMQGMFRRDQTVESCVRNARLTWLEQPTWSEACGVTIQLTIDGQLDDTQKASRIRIAIVDQAALGREVAAVRRELTSP